MDQANNMRNRAKLLIGVIAVLAAAGWYLYFDQRQQQRSLNDDLVSTRAQLQIELQGMRQELTDAGGRNQELTRQNEALTAQLAASLMEKSAVQQEMQRELESVTAAKLELQSELANIAAARLELQREMERQLREQESLNQQISAATGASEELEAKLRQEEERRLQLRQRIDAVNSDIEVKEQALSEAGKKFDELSWQLEQMQQEQGKLIATVEELNRQRDEDAAHFAELQDLLKRELNESRVEISQLKNRMTVIKLTSEVLFNTGSAEIKPAGQRVLSLIAESLNAYPTRAISIEGHTDNVPIRNHFRYASNWELSAARALAAVDFLQQNNQVDPGRLQLVGLGEYHPVASNETEEGRALNRRIEIKVLPGNVLPAN